MILYAILGLLFIVMVVLTVLSSKKDWHWLNPVLLVFIFIAGSAGMIGMAQTLNARQKVLKRLEQQQDKLETALANKQKYVFGEINSATYGPRSLRGLSQEVELLQLGRGRSWTNGKISNANGTIEFTFPAEQQEVENEDMSLEQVELYAFEDTPLTIQDEDGVAQTALTPTKFVGKFLVTSQSTTQLTLVPSYPIANWEEYGAPKAQTWTLFERMPFDRHGVFKNRYPGEKGDSLDIAQYRQWLMQNVFAPNFIGLDPASAMYERMIDQFAFDGLSIGKIDTWVDAAQNRVSPRFEPDTSEVFVKFKFTGNSTESYTVDDKTGKLDTDGTFSVQGHAVDPLLHLSPGAESRDVTFKKDDIVEIDLITAQGYQRADGTVVPPFTEREPNVEEVDRIYRRKLVDFPYEMAKLYNRELQAENEQLRLASNNEVQDNTYVQLQAQQQERTRQKVAYENDNKLLQNDIDRINLVFEQRDRQVAENARRIEMLKAKLEELRRSMEMRTSP